MYTLFYTVEEGGLLREFGQFDGNIDRFIDELRETRVYDNEASIPHAYTRLDKNVYVASVEIRDGDEWIGTYHATTNNYVTP